MTEHILSRLQERKNSGNSRKLTNGDILIDFVSNYYLGLSRSEELFQIISSYYYSEIVNNLDLVKDALNYAKYKLLFLK